MDAQMIKTLDELDALQKDDLCPTAWLRICFTHFWWVSAFPLVVIAIVSILLNILDPLNDWVFIVFSLLLAIEWRMFRWMLYCTPRDLTLLTRSGRLVYRDPSKQKTFESEFREMIKRGIQFGRGNWKRKFEYWRLSSLIVVGLMFAYIISFNSVYHWVGELFGSFGGEYPLAVRQFFSGLVAGPIPLFWAIPVGAGIWVVLAVGISLSRLTDIFILDPIPGHPDGSGGLRKLGDICLRMGLLSIMPQLVTLAVFLYGLTINTDSLVVQLAGIVSFVFAFLFIPCFAIPMWRIHKAMEQQRDNYAANLASRIVQAEDELRAYFDMQPTPNFSTVQQKIETLQKLQPTVREFPTWPFSRKIFLVIGPNLIISLLTILVTIPPEIKDAITAIFTLGQ